MDRNSDAVFSRFLLDPNADPKAEMTGEERIASSAPLRLFFVGYMAWLMTLPMVSAAARLIPSVA